MKTMLMLAALLASALLLTACPFTVRDRARVQRAMRSATTTAATSAERSTARTLARTPATRSHMLRPICVIVVDRFA